MKASVDGNEIDIMQLLFIIVIIVINNFNSILFFFKFIIKHMNIFRVLKYIGITSSITKETIIIIIYIVYLQIIISIVAIAN